MEPISKITLQATPSLGITRSSTTSTSESRNPAEVLGTILDRIRLSNGWNRKPAEEHDKELISWLEVLAVHEVPPSAFDDCYRTALKTRMRLKVSGAKVLQISAEDLAAAWPMVKAGMEIHTGQKLLAEHNPTGCNRCFGTGRELLIDGTIRAGCAHVPLTDEEVKIFQSARAKVNAFEAEALKKIGNPKPVEAPVRKPKPPTGVRLQCTKCDRRKSGLEGYVFGQKCGVIVQPEPLALCPGVMRVSDEAISARL